MAYDVLAQDATNSRIGKRMHSAIAIPKLARFEPIVGESEEDVLKIMNAIQFHRPAMYRGSCLGSIAAWNKNKDRMALADAFSRI